MLLKLTSQNKNRSSITVPPHLGLFNILQIQFIQSLNVVRCECDGNENRAITSEVRRKKEERVEMKEINSMEKK